MFELTEEANLTKVLRERLELREIELPLKSPFETVWRL